MSNQSAVANEIKKIGDLAQEKLDKLHIPPYPKHYCDIFLDILNESDNAKVIHVLKKYPQLFFKKNENSDLSKLGLSLASKSIEKFKETNEEFKNIASSSEIDLSEIKDRDDEIKTKELLNLFELFHSNLVQQIRTAEETITQIGLKIEQLETELNINILTKMNNIKALQKDLEKILKFGKDRSLDTFLILLDADNFKKINSEFGHIAGDKTLIYLSSILQSSLRQGTGVYHTKGNEFAIILNRLTRKDTISTISRIVSEISNSKLFYKGNNINLTISAGVVKHKQNDTVDALIERASDALRNAKKSGKNCFKEAL